MVYTYIEMLFLSTSPFRLLKTLTHFIFPLVPTFFFTSKICLDLCTTLRLNNHRKRTRSIKSSQDNTRRGIPLDESLNACLTDRGHLSELFWGPPSRCPREPRPWIGWRIVKPPGEAYRTFFNRSWPMQSPSSVSHFPSHPSKTHQPVDVKESRRGESRKSTRIADRSGPRAIAQCPFMIYHNPQSRPGISTGEFVKAGASDILGPPSPAPLSTVLSLDAPAERPVSVPICRCLSTINWGSFIGLSCVSFPWSRYMPWHRYTATAATDMLM